MRATTHLPERMGSLADMEASATGTVSTNVPFCPSPCECADCVTYYYTLEQQRFDSFHYAAVLTNEQAEALLAKYTSITDSARAYLQEAIQQHGNTLLDRWRKRNPKKRAALLQTVEPELPVKKGLGAEVSYSRTLFRDIRSSSAFRKHFMLPYLDVETLSKHPATLLGLLHTRAKDAPADWAPYDHEQLRSPWGVGQFSVSFNGGAVIMFGSRYGTYTSWQRDAAHRFDLVGFPRANLVLEAQATLLTFLRRIVEQLLASGVQLDGSSAMGCTRWNANIDGGLKMTGDAAAWSSFVQTPFSNPPRFDVDALAALVQARVTATGDHLSLLQTQAPYFRRYMRNLYQMQATESAREKHIAVTVITWELVEDVDLHWFWRCTMLEIKNLQDLYHRYRDSIAPGKALPKKVDQAFGAIELVLVNAIHTRSQQLQAMISQRPGFRQNYVYGHTTMDAKGMYAATCQIKKFAADENEGLAVIFQEERLWWILMQLQGQPDSHTRFR